MQRHPAAAAAAAASEGPGLDQRQVELSDIDKSETNKTSSPNVSALVTTPASLSDNEALCSTLAGTPASDTPTSVCQSIPPVQDFQESINSPPSEGHSLAPLHPPVNPPVNPSVPSPCDKHKSTATTVHVADEVTSCAKSTAVVDLISQIQESTVIAPRFFVDPISPPPNCPTGGDVDLDTMNQDSKSLSR